MLPDATRVVPAHWRTLAAVLEARSGHSVRLWFNPNLGGGFTATVMDDRNGFAPDIDEGRIWSAYAKSPVEALDDLARLVHKAIVR